MMLFIAQMLVQHQSNDAKSLNDERRNRVYEQNLLGMAKLINLFTVGKKWWRKTVSQQLIPCQSISSFP